MDQIHKLFPKQIVLENKLDNVKTFLSYLDTKKSLNNSRVSFRNILIYQKSALESLLENITLDVYQLKK